MIIIILVNKHLRLADVCVLETSWQLLMGNPLYCLDMLDVIIKIYNTTAFYSFLHRNKSREARSLRYHI